MMFQMRHKKPHTHHSPLLRMEFGIKTGQLKAR